ncbi:MAG: mrr [Clostridia bacterium]|jgi:HJR/Mrr/RecB family endonuclease|nr:mrr [Clostridia bacterium]
MFPNKMSGGYIMRGGIVEKIFDLIGAVIFITILLGIFKEAFEIPYAYIKNHYYANLDRVTFYTLLITLLIASYMLNKFVKLLKPKFTKCPHGVSGGLTELKCQQCIYEIEEKKSIEAEERRLMELRSKAESFRREEIVRYRNKLLHQVDFLYKLTPYEFEDTIMEMYRALGYNVKQTSYSNDRGKDGIAYKGNNKYLIECKRYDKDNKIGRPQLQKFFAAMHEENAYMGYFVTTSTFAQTAYEYARENKIELIDGERLARLMAKAYPDNSGDYIQTMCPLCGDIVKFSMVNNEQRKKCINNHTVERNISYEDIVKHSTQTSNYRRKRNYRRY